jgi:hypothetical protein
MDCLVVESNRPFRLVDECAFHPIICMSAIPSRPARFVLLDPRTEMPIVAEPPSHGWSV